MPSLGTLFTAAIAPLLLPQQIITCRNFKHPCLWTSPQNVIPWSSRDSPAPVEGPLVNAISHREEKRPKLELLKSEGQRESERESERHSQLIKPVSFIRADGCSTTKTSSFVNLVAGVSQVLYTVIPAALPLQPGAAPSLQPLLPTDQEPAEAREVYRHPLTLSFIPFGIWDLECICIVYQRTPPRAQSSVHFTTIASARVKA